MKKKDLRKSSRIRNLEDMPPKDHLRRDVFTAVASQLYHRRPTSRSARRRESAK